VTHRLVRIAAAANVAAVLAFSAAYAWSLTLLNTADESGHFDYAFQVWHGRLPVFEDGLAVKPPFASIPPVQWTAQHPPLYYLWEAPFIGPFVDANRDAVAAYAGRAASALIACAVVVSVMWAARAIAPGRRTFWLAAGTAAAVIPPVVAVGGTIFNDNLLVCLTALAIGVTARILREGITTRRLVALAAVGSGLLLTRASGAVIFGICGATLGVVTLLRSPRHWRQVAGLVAAGLVPLLASGWFYARNERLTGNVLGGHFGYLKHRVSRPFDVVAVDPEVWRQWHVIYGYDQANTAVMASLLVGLPLLVALVSAVRRLSRRPRPRGSVALGVVLVAIPLVTVVMQLQYISVSGGASWRYLMPMVPVICLAVAASVTLVPRLRPYLLCLWVAAAVIPLTAWVGDNLVHPDRHSTGSILPVPACIALGLGVAAVVVALVAQALISETSVPRGTTTPEPPGSEESAVRRPTRQLVS
jgi:hypothetical protein